MQRKGEDAYLSEQSCACTVANSSVGLDVYAISLQGRAKKARSRRGIHSSRHAHQFVSKTSINLTSVYLISFALCVSVGLDVYEISLQGGAIKARSRRGTHSSRHAHLFILAILLSVASDWINMNVLFKE